MTWECVGWSCDLCIGDMCRDPKCKGGLQCQAALFSNSRPDAQPASIDNDAPDAREE